MRELLSFLFDQVMDPLTLPLEPIAEWAILAVIGIVAYFVAFHIVGNMYGEGMISGRSLGSLFHWIIRGFFFILIWFVVYWVIVIGQWIMAHWMHILWGFVGITMAVIVFRLCAAWIDRALSEKDRISTKEEDI